jgi:hypothetical protein
MLASFLEGARPQMKPDPADIRAGTRLVENSDVARARPIDLVEVGKARSAVPGLVMIKLPVACKSRRIVTRRVLSAPGQTRTTGCVGHTRS